MAISNCSFSPTSENSRGFSAWCVLAKLSAKPKDKDKNNLWSKLKGLWS